MKRVRIMRALLFFVGGIFCLLISLLIFYAAFHTHDGYRGLYESQLKRSLIFFIIGIILIAAGIIILKRRN